MISDLHHVLVGDSIFSIRRPGKLAQCQLVTMFFIRIALFGGMCDLCMVFTVFLYSPGRVQLKQGKGSFFQVLLPQTSEKTFVDCRGNRCLIETKRSVHCFYLLIVCRATFSASELICKVHVFHIS